MLTISVCVGTACHVKGAYIIINKLQTMIKEKKVADKVTVTGAFCLGNCSTSEISVRINEGAVHSVSEEKLAEFFAKEIMPLIND
ncbi:MAG: (2Fe-2S) ferredoxin domain-containing protein [Peptococcaceae bacterium]